MRNIRTSRRGFTLVEVLMAVLLGGMILTAAAGFLLGIFNLNIIAEKQPQFEEHVESSSRFLEYLFSSALPPESGSSESNNNQSNRQSNDENSGESESGTTNGREGIVTWEEVPGQTGLDDLALSFEVNGDLPIFVDEELAYVPKVQCWLLFDEKEGLRLGWRTVEMRREDDQALRTSMISPYVKVLTYWYYDREDDSWEDSDEAEKADEGGEYKMPDFISVEYQNPDGREAKRLLLLPPSGSDFLLP